MLQQALDGQASHTATVRKALLVRGLGLPDWLDQGPGSAERDAAFAAVAPLTRLSVADMLEQATPFFWLNLARFYDAIESGEQIRVATGRLLAAAFDALFEQLPGDLELNAYLGPGSDLVLPRLGVQRTRDGDEVRLVRAAVEPDDSLPTLAVPGASGRVLPVADAALFEDAYRDQILTTCGSEFGAQLGKALELIRQADPETGARIAKNIEWYVPIASPDPATHCSFTSPRLHGVTFLSESDDPLRLAEALVHEFGHAELHLLMSVESLTGDISGDELFYSPWRPDPRPIAGLFHALYVFSEVLSFLSDLAARGGADASAIERRMTVVAHRLRVGIAQVPRGRLDPLGAAILDEIEQNTGLRMRTLGADSPPVIGEHLQRWRASHPALASAVVLP